MQPCSRLEDAHNILTRRRLPRTSGRDLRYHLGRARASEDTVYQPLLDGFAIDKLLHTGRRSAEARALCLQVAINEACSFLWHQRGATAAQSIASQHRARVPRLQTNSRFPVHASRSLEVLVHVPLQVPQGTGRTGAQLSNDAQATASRGE